MFYTYNPKKSQTINVTTQLKPMLAVIICTYNREKYIGAFFKSSARNDLPKSEYEIILVGNNHRLSARDEQGMANKYRDNVET